VAPDLLINNVGRALPHYFEDVTFEQFDETMRTNLYGIWSTTAALVPHMAAGAAIINVSSMAGFMGVFGLSDSAPPSSPSSASRRRSGRNCDRAGIAVSVLLPPDTDTPGLAHEDLTKPAETKAVSAAPSSCNLTTVARDLVRGIERGTFMIVPGGDGKLAYFMKRHARPAWSTHHAARHP